MAPLDVWEQFCPSLESTGVISWKFWKTFKWALIFAHSHFSVLNRWGVIRVLVIIAEARIRSLLKTAWTFCMYFNVASNFHYDFLKLLRKLSCENIYLLYSTFIKLLERFINDLAEILSIEVLQVLLRSSFKFNCKQIAFILTTILIQNTFSHVINCKLASCLASYLRSGDHIRWVVEKTMCKYEVIVSVGDENVFIFKFNCSSGKCSIILQHLPSELPLNFLGFIINYPACRPAACKKFLLSQLGLS